MKPKKTETLALPDDATILALHKKYAPSDNACHIVYEHCQVIDDITRQLIEQNHLDLNVRLVHAATLLHDIGYYPLLDENGRLPKGVGIKHGVTGAIILRKEGIHEVICRIAERHTGVGLTRESILKQHLPLPAKDLVAETPEEWLIMYADKLHSKSILPDDPRDVLGWFNSTETYYEHAKKFGQNNADKFMQLVEKYGAPDLAALAEEYGEDIK
jgi:uncharacterized protein